MSESRFTIGQVMLVVAGLMSQTALIIGGVFALINLTVSPLKADLTALDRRVESAITDGTPQAAAAQAQVDDLERRVQYLTENGIPTTNERLSAIEAKMAERAAAFKLLWSREFGQVD